MSVAVDGSVRPDNAVPFPAWAIDGGDVTRRLRSAGLDVDRARPVYLRDKPGETLVVGYDLTSGDRHERGYLRWCADRERAADDRRKAHSMGPSDSLFGPGIVAIDDHSTIRILPNDARLRRARWYLTPRKLKRTLADLDHAGRTLSGSATSVEVLTYKAERRIVARLDLGYSDGHRTSVLLRYGAGANASKLASVAEHLRRHGVATARPIAQLEHGEVGIDAFLPGVDLRTAAADSSSSQLVDAVADQIAALHRVPAPTDVTLHCRDRDRDLATALESIAWLSVRRFADRSQAAAVGRALVGASKRAALTPAVVIHGDLHDRNVLVDVDAAAGPFAALIDLERVSIGEPELDLGRLLATAIATSIGTSIDGVARPADVATVAAIVDGVAARSDRRAAADPATLAFHVANELVASALTVSRQLETIADPNLVDRLLGAALDVAHDPDRLADLARSGTPHTSTPPPPARVVVLGTGYVEEGRYGA